MSATDGTPPVEDELGLWQILLVMVAALIGAALAVALHWWAAIPAMMVALIAGLAGAILARVLPRLGRADGGP